MKQIVAIIVFFIGLVAFVDTGISSAPLTNPEVSSPVEVTYSDSYEAPAVEFTIDYQSSSKVSRETFYYLFPDTYAEGYYAVNDVKIRGKPVEETYGNSKTNINYQHQFLAGNDHFITEVMIC